MLTKVPLSRLQRSPNEVSELIAAHDVELDRRDAENFFVSTVERRERERQAQLVTTGMLAEIARTRPDLAGDAMLQTLPWMGWLPAEEKVSCLQELIDDLRAGAQTNDLRAFANNLAAWQSTAVAYNDPEVLAALRRDSAQDGLQGAGLAVEHPARVVAEAGAEDGCEPANAQASAQ